MHVNREAPTNIQPSARVCPECGLIHPPCPRGECPIKKAKELEQSKYAKCINNVMACFKSESDNLDLLADMIQKTIKVWKIKYK